MKKILFLLIGAFFSFTLIAQPPQVPATSGSTFGEKVTAENAITVERLQQMLSANAGEQKVDVKIKGVVTDVCTMEGCWIKIKSPNGKMMVKMKDHSFKVPLALNGKTVVISGAAEQQTTSIEQLRHYAEDAGKSKSEIALITKPTVEIVVDAKGVLVL